MFSLGLNIHSDPKGRSSTILEKKLKGESSQSCTVNRVNKRKIGQLGGITQSIDSRACVQTESICPHSLFYDMEIFHLGSQNSLCRTNAYSGCSRKTLILTIPSKRY